MDTFKTVMITGGYGCVGSQVINRLTQKYPNTHFVNLDCLTYAAKLDNVEHPENSYYTFVYGNICDQKLVTHVLETYHVECLLHIAGETHVDSSFFNSLVFTQTNIVGTHVLLECVRKYIQDYPDTFKLFLHMSTDEVIGSIPDGEPPGTEYSLLLPSNPYSATKSAGENLCAAYNKSFNLPIIIVRSNNIISKVQHEEKLIPCVISCILNGQKIPIHGKGIARRTFVHAYDVSDAYEIIIDKGKIGKIYSIGTDHEYTVLEVVQAILDIMKPGSHVNDHIEFVEDRAFQDYRYSIDTTALRDLGWKPSMTFKESLRDVINHMLKKMNL